MPHYLTSDVHLRLDHAERAERFGAWVDGLTDADALTIVGDLCDFWFTSRQARRSPIACPGLLALARYRKRGGELTILAGNHDAWLGPLFEKELGAKFVPDTMDLELDGLRVHLAHGHRVKKGARLKKVLESRTFLESFRLAPSPIALRLEARLNASNAHRRAKDDREQLAAFLRFARTMTGKADLIVLGHLHQTNDRIVDGARLVVLGSWHEQSSHLRIAAGRAELLVERSNSPPQFSCPPQGTVKRV